MADRPLTTGEGNTAQERLVSLGEQMNAALDAWQAERADFLAEVAGLREQLDAARQALERIMASVGTSTEAHLIARAVLAAATPDTPPKTLGGALGQTPPESRGGDS